MVKPTAYLGRPGAMIGLLGPSSQSVAGGREVTFENTMGSRKAFISPQRLREWSCELNARYPSEVAGLRWLADYGNPPFVYYGPDAVKGNILPPDAAALANGSHTGLEGPLVEVEPGRYVKSAVPDRSEGIALQTGLPRRRGAVDQVPIPDGARVTFSAYFRGDSQQIIIRWRNVLGELLSSQFLTWAASDNWVRRHRTLTAPVNATAFSLVFVAEHFAGPAVTLTEKLTPYSPGRGCMRAVVHGLSQSLILVHETRSLESASFTVTEVD